MHHDRAKNSRLCTMRAMIGAMREQVHFLPKSGLDKIRDVKFVCLPDSLRSGGFSSATDVRLQTRMLY